MVFEQHDVRQPVSSSSDVPAVGLQAQWMQIQRSSDAVARGGVIQIAESQSAGRSTAAETTFQAVAGQFDASTDKSAAMQRFGSQFESSIRLADSDYGKVLQGASDQMKQLRPRYDQAHQDMIAGANNADSAINAIKDPTQRQDVLDKASRYTQLDPTSPQAKTLAVELDRYPGLVNGLDTMRTAMQSGKSILKELGTVQHSVEQAYMDRVGTRMGYSQRLTDAGDTDKARTYKQQASDLLRQVTPNGQDGPDPLSPNQPYKIPNTQPRPARPPFKS
jgi:hypothetical protein